MMPLTAADTWPLSWFDRGVRKGFKSTSLYQHQNLLRTVMDALGINSYPGAAANAKDMAEFRLLSRPTPTLLPRPHPGLPGVQATGVRVTVCFSCRGRRY